MKIRQSHARNRLIAKPSVVGLCLCVGLAMQAVGLPYLYGQDTVDFAHDVLPLLQAKCAKCHTDGTYKAGFSFDTRAVLLESGHVVSGNSAESELLARVTSSDPEQRMPPEGEPLSAAQVATLRRWIDGGLAWEEGFSFLQPAYQAPLRLQTVALPPVVDGREHPIDRFVDQYLASHSVARPATLGDAAFYRRASLDVVGTLPTAVQTKDYANDKSSDKRDRLVQLLLSDDIGYADHWITFWNDLLRNDYEGTGYIDGGRRQITRWLYQSLLQNKPYDQLTRELLAPASDSEGFARGIKWRGRVNASQVTPLQFSQNVSQVMLGINMKCASCHDSFINEWKLKDAYGLAAIISDEPLEINRCDVPTGEMARAAFLYPELGEIDPNVPRDERLQQLAQLITAPENGRFARTIVNRLWDRLVGQPIVFPVDIMSNRPWSPELLDYLSNYLVQHDYDLKVLMAYIMTSETYALQGAPYAPTDTPDQVPVFLGPVRKRMTAEQFMDAVWQVTRTQPADVTADVGFRAGRVARASLVPANLLMRSLGRPNREQVVTTRPAELTTLQALDLTNGAYLSEILDHGAANLHAEVEGLDAAAIVDRLYWESLGRGPTDDEKTLAAELLGGQPSNESLADLLWSLFMLPEFQIVH